MKLKAIAASLLLCVITFLPQANAVVKVVPQSFESVPHQVVQDTTLKVLQALDSGLDPVKEPEEFVAKLSAILDPVVAFDYIARGVLGNYASQVPAEKVKDFSAAFKLGLVNTYGKGMSNFGDLEVAVLPPATPIGESRRVTVVQEIRGPSSTNAVSYSMAKNKQGEWKMVNVVLNGINLGLTFRGQFAATVEKNGGDVAKTIAEWGQQ